MFGVSLFGVASSLHRLIRLLFKKNTYICILNTYASLNEV